MCLIACSSDDDSPVEIRVSNSSAVLFENIVVADKEYGNLESGAFSDYQEYDIAYRNALIQVMAAQDTLVWQFIDFVGETPLSGGKYTY